MERESETDKEWKNERKNGRTESVKKANKPI